jgi:hypothetical protein
MPFDPHQIPPIFHIDVTTDGAAPERAGSKEDLIIGLLRQLVLGQERQRKLLEELVQHTSAVQRQRTAELGQWRQANPSLSRRCRIAAETLARVQNEFLHNLTTEVAATEDNLLDGEFMLNEFVDRYGPRLAHLNGVLQVLAQLGAGSDAPNGAAP